MSSNSLLRIDATVNILLGVALAVFPMPFIELLGLPLVEPPFYASILGAVLLGIGLALLLECRETGSGLGLQGAIAINLSGGACLAYWLAFGDITVPMRGLIAMWFLVLLLVGLSGIEFLAQNRKAT